MNILNKKSLNYILINKKLYFKYKILSEINSGISLKGWEVKSIKNKKVDISNSFIKINKKKEIFLNNCIITPLHYSNEKYIKYIKNRQIKLLIKKKEIYNILTNLKKK